MAVRHTAAHPRFDGRAPGRDEDSKLVSKTGEESPQRVWRKFVNVRRNHTPRSLHHELHQKRTGDDPLETWRGDPQWNQKNREANGNHHCATSATFIGKKSDQDSPRYGPNHGDYCDEGRQPRAVASLRLQERGIEI